VAEERPITELLQEWAGGSGEAREQLLPLVYEDLKSISRRVLRGESTDQVTATALVHDLYLKLVKYDSVDWNDRKHFFSFCVHLMRQILVDHARQRMADKRNAILVPLGLNELPWLAKEPATYLDLERALERLEQAEPEKAKVLELRLYLGCTSEETASILGISKATVDRHLAFTRAWMYRELHMEPAPQARG